MANTGKPPHIGWWCTSPLMGYWCWWDGEYWSIEASETDSMDDVLDAANTHRKNQEVKWCTYYPSNTIKPRINYE